MFALSLLLFILPSFLDAKFYEELSSSNFHQYLDSHDTVLVKFYAEWCGHCKNLAPEYERAAEVLKKEDIPVSLTKVNCPENDDICKEYGVQGYPTLKLFKKGKEFEDCSGKRNAESIISHMKMMAGPSLTELKSENDLDLLKSGDRSTFVAVLDTSDKESLEVFKSVSESEFKNFKFAYTLSSDLRKKLNLNTGLYRFLPSKIQSKLEPVNVRTDAPKNEADLKSWISNNWSGDLAYRMPDTESLLPSGAKSILYFKIDYERDPKGTNYIRNRCLKVIKSLSDESLGLNFAMSDSMQYNHELSQYGVDDVKEGKFPIVTIREESGRKFLMSETFSWDNMKKFFLDYKAGKLEPFIKSEAIPEKNDEPVKIVVAKNFDEIVNDPTKDVLIQFYSPYCGHCQRLKPTYDEVAEAMSSESNIVIVKMDATKNDVPKEYAVSGFPTIYFTKKDMKTMPIPYNGNREKSDFIKFISSHASQPLSNFDSDGKPIKKEL